MMDYAYYPWQKSQWEKLTNARERLPHAILLSGPRGIGKLDFARAFSQLLLCQNSGAGANACGNCPSCHWFSEQSHPDFREVTLEQEVTDEGVEVSGSKRKSKKNQISVAQIRELSDFLNLSSHQTQGIKIALIHPAEAMNQAASNALLKMLEEPPERSLFLLVTHQPNMLLPTILSRCHKMKMALPEAQQAEQWLLSKGIKTAQKQLHYFGGSPLMVLQQAESEINYDEIWRQLAQGSKLNPAVLAPILLKSGVDSALSILQKWSYDLLSSRLCEQMRYHGHYADVLMRLAVHANMPRLMELQAELTDARMTAAHPLNWELQIEAILVKYTQLFEREGGKHAAKS